VDFQLFRCIQIGFVILFLWPVFVFSFAAITGFYEEFGWLMHRFLVSDTCSVCLHIIVCLLCVTF
jgi:hypothetical protein